MINSDNGTNFVGADRELREAAQSQYQMKQLIVFSANQNFIASSGNSLLVVPGLWEAGVCSMKGLLKKMVKPHPLSFEELTTLLTEAEATLNSRPLLTSDSLPLDGVPILTPAHF